MPRYAPNYMGPMAGGNFQRRQGSQLQAAGNQMRRYSGPDARPAGDRSTNAAGVERLRAMLGAQRAGPQPNARALERANANARFNRMPDRQMMPPQPMPPVQGQPIAPTPMPPVQGGPVPLPQPGPIMVTDQNGAGVEALRAALAQRGKVQPTISPVPPQMPPVQVDPRWSANYPVQMSGLTTRQW